MNINEFSEYMNFKNNKEILRNGNPLLNGQNGKIQEISNNFYLENF